MSWLKGTGIKVVQYGGVAVAAVFAGVINYALTQAAINKTANFVLSAAIGFAIGHLLWTTIGTLFESKVWLRSVISFFMRVYFGFRAYFRIRKSPEEFGREIEGVLGIDLKGLDYEDIQLMRKTIPDFDQKLVSLVLRMGWKETSTSSVDAEVAEPIVPLPGLVLSTKFRASAASASR